MPLSLLLALIKISVDDWRHSSIVLLDVLLLFLFYPSELTFFLIPLFSIFIRYWQWGDILICAILCGNLPYSLVPFFLFITGLLGAIIQALSKKTHMPFVPVMTLSFIIVQLIKTMII